jgi:hypothetical protein
LVQIMILLIAADLFVCLSSSIKGWPCTALHCTQLAGSAQVSVAAPGLIFVGAVIIGINTCVCPPVV